MPAFLFLGSLLYVAKNRRGKRFPVRAFGLDLGYLVHEQQPTKTAALGGFAPPIALRLRGYLFCTITVRELEMAEWMTWFVFAGALVILEMFTGTFYLLMIGFGLIAGGLAAMAGLGREGQLVCAGIIGAIATYGLRRSKWGRVSHRQVGRDPNVNLDIGQTLRVEAWNEDGRTSRATYRGALWDVELEHGADSSPGNFTIREVRGNRLIVSKNSKQDN